MKLLTLFLIGLTSFSESKSLVNQFKHTSYLYNSTQCNNSEPIIVELINYDKCNINNLNKCFKSVYPKNGSIFNICAIEPVLNNINAGVSVFLTILIIFLIFLLYKMICESELDTLCLKIKYKLEIWFCCNDEETQHINNYNSL
jgi:hypothetical protein